MEPNKMSFFGEKLDGLVDCAKGVAENLKFSDKIENTINELWEVINVFMNSTANVINEDKDDHFSEPVLETKETEHSFDNISIDDLIIESYSFGKTEEELFNEVAGELKATVRQYCWLLVALGIALDHEDKKQIVKSLKIKCDQLNERVKQLKLIEEKLMKKKLS